MFLIHNVLYNILDKIRIAICNAQLEKQLFGETTHSSLHTTKQEHSFVVDTSVLFLAVLNSSASNELDSFHWMIKIDSCLLTVTLGIPGIPQKTP